MQKIKAVVITLVLFLVISSCNDQPGDPGKPASPKKEKPVRKEPKNLSYHFEPTKQWLQRLRQSPDSAGKKIILSVNRVDLGALRGLDSIIIPSDLSGDINFYLPFPTEVKGLEEFDKIIFFSYPTQAFGAYENGQLVYAGPTSMGSKSHPTPEGLYFTNWKAEETISTFDDEWELKWNFNIQNKEGIGWHQYELPGYPASHSCLRLLESDAKVLYNWADQWKLKGNDVVLLNGTPVIVFGSYPFDGPKPWLQLVGNPKALDISASTIEGLVAPHKAKILEEQQKRQAGAVATDSDSASSK